MIGIIAAMTIDRVIGIYDNPKGPGRLPSNTINSILKADMCRFREITDGSNIIMGRKTWESIKCSPLSNRKNIIISSTMEDGINLGYRVCNSVKEVMRWAFIGDIWFIGGHDVFHDAIDFVNVIDITIIPCLSRTLCKPSVQKVYFPIVNEKIFCRYDSIHPYNRTMRTIRYVKR